MSTPMSEPTFGTVLVPERQMLIPYVGCSVLAHGAVILAVVLFTAITGLLPSCHREPAFHESIEISMVALPKSAHNVPDRAARVKRAAGEEKAVEPPPVKQSDLVIHDDEPPPVQGNAEEARRQQILDEIERRRMLEDLDAPDGTQDRNATDPNGAEDLNLAVLGAAARGNPAWARWMAQVQQLIRQHFRPITQGQPDLLCKINIKIDESTGAIESWEVAKSSGVLSYDAAAERAIQDIGTLPLPAEELRPLLASEYVTIDFTPPQ
ncbi:MAG: cell envelope integrity protein TolA [Myxococcota bacterium]